MSSRLLVLLLFVCVACAGRRARDDADGRHTIEHGGRTRSYILRLPPAAPRSAQLPLVLVLHGGGGNGANAETMTGFTALARAEGFMVAYPEGTARGRLRLLTWNAGHCCGYAMQSDVDDVGFLRLLIDHLASRYPIDPGRIYVTGMSNGAMMAHRAGLELPDRIAAIAPVAGGVFGDESARGGGVSALMINGLLDRNVPYAGGAPGGPGAGSWDGTPVRPAFEQARLWAGINRCRPVPDSIAAGALIRIRYHCPDPAGVELVAVQDNGHAWPGGQRGSARGDVPSTALDATRVIWDFFGAHPKR